MTEKKGKGTLESKQQLRQEHLPTRQQHQHTDWSGVT